jgi:hypothetical protein
MQRFRRLRPELIFFTSVAACKSRLENRRPADDLGLHKPFEELWLAFLLARKETSQLGQPALDRSIIERHVQGCRKFLDHLLGHARGREDARPDIDAVIDPYLLGGGNIG